MGKQNTMASSNNSLPQDAYLKPPPSGTSSRASSESFGSGLGTFAEDPRFASTQSLVPSVIDVDLGSGDYRRRRVLLLIYVHGFYGSAQSFRSYPYHVHAFLKEALAETHAVHTKIYPRYKCYRAIEVARDNFSAWLRPHESPNTDVVLIGHSMGGLLAADVVLKANQNPYHNHPFQHRILGTVSLDTPFLGLHPGIIASGLASLFVPQEKGPDTLDETSTLASSYPSTIDVASPMQSQSLTSMSTNSTEPPDPFYNPPYWNDKEFKEQSLFTRLENFANKHQSEGLYRAVRNHVFSHLEFAGSMADYPALNQRYNKIRALEDVDQVRALSEGHVRGAHARVRFVNYYTLSPGRPKNPKPPVANMEEGWRSQDISPSPYGGTPSDSRADLSLTPLSLSQAAGPSDSPAVQLGLTEVHSIPEEDEPLTVLVPRPISEASFEPPALEAKHPPEPSSELLSERSPEIPAEKPSEFPAEKPLDSPLDQPSDQPPQQPSEPPTPSDIDLPPIPDPPVAPILPNLDLYTDKSMRKQAEKESRRLQRAYDNALKDRAKALREREKLLQRRQKKADKEVQKQQQKELKQQKQQQREEQKEQQRLQQQRQQEETPDPPTSVPGDDVEEAAVPKADNKPKKFRKFCTLPRSRNGNTDPTWVDIYMDGMDEVSAHTSLFMPGPHYDRLVGDTSIRILRWVEDDLSRRAILETMGYAADEAH